MSGARQGKGKLQLPNGELYDGEWHASKPHGRGRYRFANGDFYAGSYVDGVIHGTGAYTASTGELYKGEWVGGLRQGRGHLQDTEGNVFEGEFANDHRVRGIYTLVTGARYSMTFADDEAQTCEPLPAVGMFTVMAAVDIFRTCIHASLYLCLSTAFSVQFLSGRRSLLCADPWLF